MKDQTCGLVEIVWDKLNIFLEKYDICKGGWEYGRHPIEANYLSQGQLGHQRE